MKPLFISVEGLDGAGKTTLIPLIKDAIIDVFRLCESGIVTTREPGGVPLAEKLRSLIFDNPMDILTEAILMYGARNEHVHQFIKPALANGLFVLTDRFADSTFALQGAGGLSIEKIQTLEKLVLNDFREDITFILDLPVEISQQRLMRSGKGLNRLDLQSVERHNKIREYYKFLARNNPDRIKLIDASRSIDEVMTDVINHLKQYRDSH